MTLGTSVLSSSAGIFLVFAQGRAIMFMKPPRLSPVCFAYIAGLMGRAIGGGYIALATLAVPAAAQQVTYSITTSPSSCTVSPASPNCVFTVTLSPLSPATITVPSTVIAGQPMTIVVDHNPSPTVRDWVAIVSCTTANVCESDSTQGTWVYLNGTTVPPATPTPLPATVTLTAPGPGRWEARYLANDQFTVLARVPFTSRPAPTITVLPQAIIVYDTIAKGGVVAHWTCTNADGTTCQVTMPNTAGGVFALLNDTIIVDPAGPGLPPIPAGEATEKLSIQLATVP